MGRQPGDDLAGATKQHRDASRDGADAAVLVGGRYKLIRPLGQGGAAAVFEATDLGLGTKVALKRLTKKATKRAAVDFGALSAAGPCAEVVGTPPFMAPEVFGMQAIDNSLSNRTGLPSLRTSSATFDSLCP